MITNAVKECEICKNKKSGEFITIEDKKIHLNCVSDLIQEKQDLIKYLESKEKAYRLEVIRYETGRRDLSEKSKYKQIFQNQIHKLNAKREEIKEILDKVKGENNE